MNGRPGLSQTIPKDVTVPSVGKMQFADVSGTDVPIQTAQKPDRNGASIRSVRGGGCVITMSCRQASPNPVPVDAKERPPYQ